MPDLLLDTCALIWWWSDDAALSAQARQAIGEADEVCVSAASFWEIATKTRLGKLPGMTDFATNFPHLLAANDFKVAAIDERDAWRAGTMDSAHRDPFDRMIAAQAVNRDKTVVTCDTAFAHLPCKCFW